MSWAEVKHALNSTLGTNNFKSLNNIFTDAEDSIATAITNAEKNYEDFILSNKLLVRQNDSAYTSYPLIVLLEKNVMPSENDSPVTFTFTSRISGICTVSAVTNNTSLYRYPSISISANGEIIKTYSPTRPQTDDWHIVGDFTVEAGVTYTITYTQCEMRLTGRIIDGNYFSNT